MHSFHLEFFGRYVNKRPKNVQVVSKNKGKYVAIEEQLRY